MLVDEISHAPLYAVSRPTVHPFRKTPTPMSKLNEYKEALQQTEQQLNQLSIQRERLVGAISALQEVAEAEQVEEPSAED